MKKTAKLLILCILSTLLSGCYNYRDINKVTFVTSAILDRDPLDNVVIYLECIRPFRSANESSDKGKRVSYTGRGKTLLEAIRDVGRSSSFKVDFTQNRAYIFTEDAARKGIRNYIDLINRNQELLVKPNMFIYFGSVDALVKFSDNDEEYLGFYLHELVQKMKSTPQVVYNNTNDFLVERLTGSKISIMGGLRFKENATGKKLELSGAGIFREDKMIEQMSPDEGLSYNFLRDKVKSGTLEVPNPEDQDSFTTLEILNSRTTTDVQYDGSRVKLYKKIDLTTSIAESQQKLIVDQEKVEIMKNKEKENMRSHLNRVFDKYKKLNIDIFEIQNRLEKKYPGQNIPNAMKNTDLIIDVDMDIKGASKAKNTL
ncbi:MAG: Ger(x)C family spore germination protein [Clostridiaceae bacterium]